MPRKPSRRQQVFQLLRDHPSMTMGSFIAEAAKQHLSASWAETTWAIFNRADVATLKDVRSIRDVANGRSFSRQTVGRKLSHSGCDLDALRRRLARVRSEQ